MTSEADQLRIDRIRDLHDASRDRRDRGSLDDPWWQDVNVLLAEIDRLARFEAIVRDLAAELWPMASEAHHCMHCGVHRGLNPEDHTESCPWRRACELMSTQPGPGDNDGE